MKKYAIFMLLGVCVFATPLCAQQNDSTPTTDVMPALERSARQAAAAAKESKAAQTPQEQPAAKQTHAVWTCAFCGEPILHDHQKCTNQRDNPFGICTHKDLNWGTPLHKGRHHEGREKSSYNVPFEPQQVVIEQKVWTCAFCGEPILHEHQKCTNQQDNPFGVCTHEDLNYGTPLHKGEHREGREKTRYNVPFEPKQVVISESKTPQTSTENNQ